MARPLLFNYSPCSTSRFVLAVQLTTPFVSKLTGKKPSAIATLTLRLPTLQTNSQYKNSFCRKCVAYWTFCFLECVRWLLVLHWHIAIQWYQSTKNCTVQVAFSLWSVYKKPGKAGLRTWACCWSAYIHYTLQNVFIVCQSVQLAKDLDNKSTQKIPKLKSLQLK